MDDLGVQGIDKVTVDFTLYRVSFKRFRGEKGTEGCRRGGESSRTESNSHTDKRVSEFEI